MEEDHNLNLHKKDCRMKEKERVNSTKGGVMYKALFRQCM